MQSPAPIEQGASAISAFGYKQPSIIMDTRMKQINTIKESLTEANSPIFDSHPTYKDMVC